MGSYPSVDLSRYRLCKNIVVYVLFYSDAKLIFHRRWTINKSDFRLQINAIPPQR
jgi:hypothetical protein